MKNDLESNSPISEELVTFEVEIRKDVHCLHYVDLHSLNLYFLMSAYILTGNEEIKHYCVFQKILSDHHHHPAIRF